MFKLAVINLKSIVTKVKSFSSKFFSGNRGTVEMTDTLDVLVFGSSNVDFITYMNKLPQPGETLHAMHREQCFGGKGANQCVAAAKLGANCAFVTKFGNDDHGADYFNYLREMGINMDYVEMVEDVLTGMAQINVDDNAENTIVIMAGANMMLNAKDATRSKKLFKQAKVLLCQLETEDKGVLTALKQFKGISVLNAAPARNNLNINLIRAPTILCVNEIEAAQLTNRETVKTLQDAKEAAIELIQMGAKSVIITMGALGAVHLSKNEPDVCTHCPAAPVRFLADTSGAGDAFLGSLAYHMARFPNLSRECHINAANICAAYAVGHRGTQPSFPGPDFAQHNLCQMEPIFSIIPDRADEPEQEANTAPVAKSNENVQQASDTAVKEPEKAVASPEPEKVVASPEPEKAVASPEPEKAVASPEPEKAVASPEPEKAVASPEPEKAVASPEPEKAVASPEPEKAVANPESVPKKAMANPDPLAEKTMSPRESKTPAGPNKRLSNKPEVAAPNRRVPNKNEQAASNKRETKKTIPITNKREPKKPDTLRS